MSTAARVEAVGHGGQVLITAATYDALCRAHFDFSTVVVKEHGAVPLRGLDESIAILTVLPTALQARRFKPLRLQIETALLNEISDQHSPAGSLDAHELLDDVAERFAKRLGGAVTAKVFLDRLTFFETVFSTCPSKYQREVVGYLKRQWGVDPHVRQTTEPKEQGNAAELVALVAKMSAAAHVKQRRCRSPSQSSTTSPRSATPRSMM